MRKIILDTETTGLKPALGARLAEIGALEVIDGELTGKTFQTYLQPFQLMPAEAGRINGLTDAFLADKPRFKDIANDLIAFIEGAELIIHNAPFDIGFIEHEFSLLDGFDEWTNIVTNNKCKVTCTAQMARNKFPYEKVSLDALCRKFNIDISHREIHGAIKDCELLYKVYVEMMKG